MVSVFRTLLFIHLCTLTLVFGRYSYCNRQNVIASFKRPTYDFSVRILDRVATQTNFHFAFSPLSTWLQLMTLGEGARGSTQKEIWMVTRYHRHKCFRRKYREILNSMDKELSFMTKRTNVIVIDKLLDVKESFVDEVKKTNRSKIFSLNFNEPEHVAAKINEAIDSDQGTNVFEVDDFNMKVLLMTDTAYFKSDWLKPFNPLYTSTETFYSEQRVPKGQVKLMHQMEFFNVAYVPNINANVLELPFNADDRFSMLIFLPTEGSVLNLFYNLQEIRLASIFNLFKTQGSKLVDVVLPRFRIKSELRNIPELVFDMGAKRMFYPEVADFRDITDYPVYASLMTQVADVEVTEQGATGSVIAESLIRNPEDSIPFRADRPFAYIIVDKLTETILFGGMYSYPSIY